MVRQKVDGLSLMSRSTFVMGIALNAAKPVSTLLLDNILGSPLLAEKNNKDELYLS